FEKIPEDILWHNQKLFDYILEQELAEEDLLLTWVGEAGGTQMIATIQDFRPLQDFANKVDIGFARRHGFMLGHFRETPALLTAKPFSMHGPRMASLHIDQVPLLLFTTENQVRNLLDLAYRERLRDDSGALDMEQMSDELQETDNLMNVRDKSPLVRLFYESITHAIDNQASDIHYQPYEEGLIIRERLDGVRQDVKVVPRSQQEALLSLIKVMGAMDIAERRKHQDGRATRFYSDQKVDIRISVVPTQYGERAVMRLLNRSAKLLDLNSLGLKGENLRMMQNLIENFTHGIILVTGPTGSGKSTTLCAVLSTLNAKELNIMTIEDPIEYELKGISQIEVQEKKDVTFSSGLRSLVRQDPDVMMVGEIRDSETASMAVQAALTGHLVFSTLHTNDAPGAISRMQDLGVEPFLIASSVVAMMAQRLVRRVCRFCKQPYDPSEEELRVLGLKREEVAGKLVKG
ncbi:MAG: Flp pilus assembly complex ATPase component TadA, partial [Planctomycetes bacterium]|nr:Flp pilus assembly complex ATPase component TadA [Planctomycetota bacterium]